MATLTIPITIAVVNDFQVVVSGVARMLAQDARLDIIEFDFKTDPQQAVDVVLYDAFAAGGTQIADVTRLLKDRRYGHVVVYTWQVDEDQRRPMLELGVSGFLSKALTAGELGDAIVQVHAGERIILPSPAVDDEMEADWPGRREGLTPREAEVVALITQGITNEQIAQSCYLSINSVKSYIRSAYRKMGVERRSQAVLWGVRHNFQLLPGTDTFNT